MEIDIYLGVACILMGGFLIFIAPMFDEPLKRRACPKHKWIFDREGYVCEVCGKKPADDVASESDFNLEE